MFVWLIGWLYRRTELHSYTAARMQHVGEPSLSWLTSLALPNPAGGRQHCLLCCAARSPGDVPPAFLCCPPPLSVRPLAPIPFSALKINRQIVGKTWTTSCVSCPAPPRSSLVQLGHQRIVCRYVTAEAFFFLWGFDYCSIAYTFI